MAARRAEPGDVTPLRLWMVAALPGGLAARAEPGHVNALEARWVQEETGVACPRGGCELEEVAVTSVVGRARCQPLVESERVPIPGLSEAREGLGTRGAGPTLE